MTMFRSFISIFLNRYKCTLRLEFWLKNLHHYWLRNTEFPANTTVLIIECCYQFKNMEKTGIVKRKINCSIRPYNFTFLLSIREHWEHTVFPHIVSAENIHFWIWPYVLWPLDTVHKCAETIQGRKLFTGRNYMRKYGMPFLFKMNIRKEKC